MRKPDWNENVNDPRLGFELFQRHDNIAGKSFKGSYSSARGGNILYRRWENHSGKESRHLLIAPKSIHNEILRHLHCSKMAGHLGVKKTLARVHQRFYWMNWRRFVQEWCKTCDKCASRKSSHKPRGPLKIYNVGYPMERVAIDVLGPFPKTDCGNDYILVAQDYFTVARGVVSSSKSASDYCCTGVS